MIGVAFSINAACAFWRGDIDITIELSAKEYVILQQAIADAQEKGWSYLDENGICAALFSRIHEAIMEFLKGADLGIDPNEVEFLVRVPKT